MCRTLVKDHLGESARYRVDIPRVMEQEIIKQVRRGRGCLILIAYRAGVNHSFDVKGSSLNRLYFFSLVGAT